MASYQKVLRKSELPEGKGRCVELNGRRIALFNVGGEFLAIDDTCTHAEASLAEGALIDGRTVECPWHGAQFDIKTGAAKTLPAVEPVKTYPVRVAGEDVEVEI